MTLLDMLDAIRRDNLDDFRTLHSTQKCSDTQDFRNTLFYEAVKENKKAITEFLLQVGFNPNSIVHCSTALHIAARNGNLEIIEILLNHGADINAKDVEGTSALVHAISKFRYNAARLLLERGARLFSDNIGRSPLHLAAIWGSLKIIKILLQKGAPVNAVITAGYYKGYTPLHYACSSFRKDIDIIEFLLSNKAEINVRAYDSRTPLYLAINCKKEDFALFLINRGAKLDDEFSDGRTILSLALERRLSSTVQEILTRCPDPQGEMKKCKKIFESLRQKTMLMFGLDIDCLLIAIREGWIQINEFDDIIKSSLHIAVQTGRIESVEVLIANGADVNAATRIEKLTPLHVACEGSKPKLVQVFLDHNADVNLRDKNGKTALHFAASECSNSTKLLLENKANVNSQDNNGFTALHFAIDSKNYDVIELLLNFGADINIKDRNNHTPIDILNRCPIYYDDLKCLTLTHALALEAINLYYAKDLRSTLSKLDSSDQIKMESHFENCKQEIEKLKLVKVPGYNLTCYALMTRSIHSVASYVKNADLITHFQSDGFTTEFPIYAPIIEGRLRNAFQRRPLICGAGDFFNNYFQLPHVCVDYILSCLSSDDLMNVKDAM